MLTPNQSRLRLVSIYMEPDGDIQIQWYSQNNADPSNRSRIRFLFSDPEQFRNRMYFCQNNADVYLESAAAAAGFSLLWIRMENLEPMYNQNNADLSNRNQYGFRIRITLEPNIFIRIMLSFS